MTDNQQTQLTPPTLRDALLAANAGVLELPWTENSWKKFCGSLSKAESVFDALDTTHSTAQVVCDSKLLRTLVANYLDNETAPRNCGFKSYKAFYDWYSNTKRFFDLVSGARTRKTARRTRCDRSAKLLELVSKGTQELPPISVHEAIPLTVFIRCCHETGIDIHQASKKWLEETISAQPSGRSRTLKRAAKLFDQMRENPHFNRSLLPPEIFGDLSSINCAGSWAAPGIHPEFGRARDEYIQSRIDGARTARLGTHDFRVTTRGGISSNRAKALRQAINWFHHGTVVAGIVDLSAPDVAFPLDRLSDPTLIAKIVELDASGALRRTTSSKTRGDRVRVVIKFLEFQFPGFESQVDPAFFEAAELNNSRHHKTTKAKWKEDTTLEFLQDRELQRRFFGMPKRFFDEARHLIERWEQIGPEPNTGRVSKLQNRALDLAIMSVYTTITTRFPLRRDSLMQLQVSGKNAHVILPERSQKACAKIILTGDIVKNDVSLPPVELKPARTHDPLAVLRWYLDHAQQLVIKYKVRNPARSEILLFGGMTGEPVAKKFKRYTAEAGLLLDPHMVRHLAGSILYARGVDISHIACLLGISEATVLKNYVFLNKANQMQTTTNEIAEIFRGLNL